MGERKKKKKKKKKSNSWTVHYNIVVGADAYLLWRSWHALWHNRVILPALHARTVYTYNLLCGHAACRYSEAGYFHCAVLKWRNRVCFNKIARELTGIRGYNLLKQSLNCSRFKNCYFVAINLGIDRRDSFIYWFVLLRNFFWKEINLKCFCVFKYII